MQLNDETQKIVDRVQKLLNLAARGGTEAEASAAAEAAQKLLTSYNLDMATVERSSGAKSGAREDAKVSGGMYIYERRLWQEVAQLNFCLYFTTREKVVRPDLRRGHRWVFRHRVVGRIVNTTATKIMGDYLQSAIERLSRERFPLNREFFSSHAVAFREGMADRVVEKLRERREEMVDAETRKREADEKRARAEGRVPTSMSLQIQVLVDAEHDANMDFLRGEGWSARQAARIAEREAERAAAEADADRRYTEWAQAHPEEAAREAKKAAARERQRWSRPGRRYSAQPTGAERRQNSQHYYSGYDTGGRIGLDPQTDGSSGSRKRIT